ncbi:Beta-lactamase [Mycena venus]|uniref:Beta-lactamase n=1 Tax=Mycena venus TaxID=2733690 RepID=A0A8H7CI24_9AGAR|nr:Beta-lactamase [Mycena venus]
MAAKVYGTCDSRFKKVEELFQSYLDSGEELGASFTVNIDGRDVVDLWGGYADASRTRAWERDTITCVWSTTKCITALAVLILIDRGLISPFDKVSKYWPEFAANGKQDVEVRHFLSHTSGVPGWDAILSLEEVCDLPTSTALLAAQPPLVGTRHTVRLPSHHLRAPQRRARPARHRKIPPRLHRRGHRSPRRLCAHRLPARLPGRKPLAAHRGDHPPARRRRAAPADEPHHRESDALPAPDAAMANSVVWRRGELGGGNGHGNARGVARLLSAIALAGSDRAPPSDRDDVSSGPLLSRATVDMIFDEQVRGVDLVSGIPVRFGMGMGLAGKGTIGDWLPDEGAESRLCFWGGWGGSAGIVDVGRRMTVAYVMNKMENVAFGNERTKGLVGAVYEALGVRM